MIQENKGLEFKFRIAIIFFCASIFVIGVIWITKNDRTMNIEYPEINSSDEINGDVVSIEVERSFARVKFESGVQRTVYFARNNSYTPNELSFLLQKGDHFIKRASSDTVKVVRGESFFIFVLGKEIYCCK